MMNDEWETHFAAKGERIVTSWGKGEGVRSLTLNYEYAPNIVIYADLKGCKSQPTITKM